MSFNPLVIYDRDSDDSSSEGGYSDNHVAMGIGNDACRDDRSDYSLDSSLFTDASNDEMDGTGLDGNFNPQGLRIDEGKRVGIDTDDESDDEGEHGLYHIDKDIAYRGMEDRSGMRGAGGSISSGSFSSGNSSDDDIDWNMKGNGTNQTWVKTEKDVDDGVPVGSARIGEIVDAGHPSTDRTTEEIAETRRQGKESFAQQKREAEDTAGRQRNKVLVQEALAKARSLKGTARAHQVAVAERLAEGTLTGRRVRTAEGYNVAEKTGRTLAPSLKAKGMSAIRSGVSGALNRELNVKQDATAREREASAKAERNLVRSHSGMQKHAEDKALKVISRGIGLRRNVDPETGQVKPSYRQQLKGKALQTAKANMNAKADKFFALKSLAKMKSATKEKRLARLLVEASQKQRREFIRKAVQQGVLAEARARQFYADLLKSDRERNISDDESVGSPRASTTITRAEDPAGSVVASRVRAIEGAGGGGGARARAPSVADDGMSAEKIAEIEARGGYVYDRVNVITLSGKSVIHINGVKMTSNEANRSALMELIKHYDGQPASPQKKAILHALNLKKRMMDSEGRGGGVPQSVAVLKRPSKSSLTVRPLPPHPPARGGGGGGGGGGALRL